MLVRSYLVLQYLLTPVKSFHILHETTFLSKVLQIHFAVILEFSH